jgi:hypothetical protein
MLLCDTLAALLFANLEIQSIQKLLPGYHGQEML